jgi:mRNA interferase RelE/StbE
LAGSQHTYRIRVGDYRVIYEVIGRVLMIEVLRVAHRKDVYR